VYTDAGGGSKKKRSEAAPRLLPAVVTLLFLVDCTCQLPLLLSSPSRRLPPLRQPLSLPSRQASLHVHHLLASCLSPSLPSASLRYSLLRDLLSSRQP
jgi:hypothetical protein